MLNSGTQKNKRLPKQRLSLLKNDAHCWVSVQLNRQTIFIDALGHYG